MLNFIIRHRIIVFFALTTLLGYGPMLLSGKPVWFMYGMPISGIILTILLQGWRGVLGQLKSAIRIKAPLFEYLKISALLISANVLTLLIAYVIFGDIPSFKMIRTEPLLLPLLFLVILLGGPLVEEVFGLRGYALPELLKTKSPLVSSLIVGAYFGAWHFVEFIRPGSTQYAIGLPYYPLFIIAEMAVSILMTHFYQRNKNNLFFAGIFFHWMMNNAAIIFQTDLTFSGIQYSPTMNKHYFVIYTILISGIAMFAAAKNKMHLFRDKDAEEELAQLPG